MTEDHAAALTVVERVPDKGEARTFLAMLGLDGGSAYYAGHGKLSRGFHDFAGRKSHFNADRELADMNHAARSMKR